MTIKPRSKLFEFPADIKRIIVVGDLHGDLLSFNQAVEYWQQQKGAYLLFLGDYADRGPNGVEILEALMDLSADQNVVALKGNHEDYPDSGHPTWGPCTLIDEVGMKRGDWSRYFRNRLLPFFKTLPFAACLPGYILFVHGGVSTKVNCFDDLRYPIRSAELDVLWSDPFEGEGQMANPTRGLGVMFGQDITTRILGRLGLQTIIRSHEPQKAKAGPFLCHNGQVITISTTNSYGFGFRPHIMNITLQADKPAFDTIILS